MVAVAESDLRGYKVKFGLYTHFVGSSFSLVEVTVTLLTLFIRKLQREFRELMFMENSSLRVEFTEYRF